MLTGEVRQIIGNTINLCWEADWARLYRLLEEISGLNKGQLAKALGVKYDTLRSWREGRRIPQRHHFALYAEILRGLTGVDPEIMWQARARSIAAREGGLVPRPEWAILYTQAGLELSFYLQRLREQADLSVDQVAAALGAPPEDYRAWENGQRVPRRWQLPPIWRKLARGQGLLLSELEAARIRGAQATADQRRRSMEIRYDRVTLLAIEWRCSRRRAAEELRYRDMERRDYNYDYERQCLKPEYVRNIRREMGLMHWLPQPTATD